MFPLKDSVRVNSWPFVTWLLVAINVIFFAFEAILPPEDLGALVHALGVIPSMFIHHFGWYEVGTVFSSMFVHGGIGHVAGNMWFLFIFGDAVEDRIGHLKYLLLYLYCGFLAAVVQVFFDAQSTMPMVGASGAISGILGAYFKIFPKATVSTFLIAGFFSRIIELPAVFYLGLWFLMQLFSGLFSIGQSGASPDQGVPAVAFWAHASGFVIGILAAKFLYQPDQWESYNDY